MEALIPKEVLQRRNSCAFSDVVLDQQVNRVWKANLKSLGPQLVAIAAHLKAYIIYMCICIYTYIF